MASYSSEHNTAPFHCVELGAKITYSGEIVSERDAAIHVFPKYSFVSVEHVLCLHVTTRYIRNLIVNLAIAAPFIASRRREIRWKRWRSTLLDYKMQFEYKIKEEVSVAAGPY
jgi:hypothetical protein